MDRSRHPLLAALAALLAVALLTGCGGSGGGDADNGGDAGGDSGALAVTLTDTECTYEGPASVPAGPISIGVENESESPGRFELLRLAADAAPEDLVAYVAGEQLAVSDGQEPAWPPSYTTIVDRIPVRARWNTTLSGEVQAGSYGVVCWVAPPPTAVYLATTFDVG